MKTDVFVKVLSDTAGAAEMEEALDEAFRMFRAFESRFSRFLPESELSRFNASEKMVVSPDFFSLLESAKRRYEETDGLFDPSILSALKAEGYDGSFLTESFGIPGDSFAEKHFFRELRIDPVSRMTRKPIGLKIDLGGIGKGYVVDRVAEFLKREYEHFFICAGGDICAGGKNMSAGYDYWAVDVEDPVSDTASIATLLLSDRAVATSGVDRRRWAVDGRERHHLIDPRTGRSAETDLVSVTVVGETVEAAEVWSKSLVILGLEEGRARAEEKHIPALFVTREGKMEYNGHIGPFLWKERV
ncbi:MAG: FAD:protein FMN transferase [Candidatus Moranbacteria bacterium]|nr:FAD:protein FMN transferase [Candidatus Moranbacteria bacterium]